jgi:hypothetical protein
MRLVWWFTTVLAVGIVSIFLSEQGTLDPARNLTLTASAPVESVLRDAASPIDDIYEGISDRGQLARDNEQLRAEVERLQAELAAQEDAEARIRELENALGVKQQRPDDQLLAANVIAEDPSALKRMVAIDRGIGDGIDEGMVVLSVAAASLAPWRAPTVRLRPDPARHGSGSAVNAQVNAASSAAPASPTPAPAATPRPTRLPRRRLSPHCARRGKGRPEERHHPGLASTG